MLTHRIRRDPFRHLLYDNLDDFTSAAVNWLRDHRRRPQHTLGVGIDRSDSLLYEGVIGHIRSLAPIFGNSDINTTENRLVLLTKTTNVGYLEEIDPKNRALIVVSFSLNPEPIADLWEGKWPDTNDRITPPISDRLDAAKRAQDLGFEVRIRLDPILPPDNWIAHYKDFVAEVKAKKIDFTYWTLGTYREKNSQLGAWAERWGLPPMEWEPQAGLVQDGTHWHLSERRRVDIYRQVLGIVKEQFPRAMVSLCKESHGIRRELALINACCNCLS